MNFCVNCGNKIDGTKFCTKCGAEVEKAFANTDIMNNNISELREKRKTSPIIALLLVIAVTVIVFLIFGGRNYKSLVKTYVKATIKGDAKKIVSLMPDKLVDYIAEEEYDGDKEEMIFDLEDGLYSMMDQIEDYGVDISKLSYKITEDEDMDEAEIKSLEREYRKAKLDIKKGKELEVELMIPVDGEEKTNTVYLTVVKIGRSWYLIYD